MLKPSDPKFPRSGTIKEAKSSEYRGRPNGFDMIQFTIRGQDTLYTTFDNYSQFPFDALKFTFRFEMSHFVLKLEDSGNDQEYRFDFYEQSDNSIECKPNLGKVPELVLNTKGIRLRELKEKKPHKIKD